MKHEEKVRYMLEDLKGKGISPYTAAPPLWRLLWLCGFSTPPPLFLSTFRSALLMGAAYGFMLGAALVFWGGLLGFMFVFFAGGLFFGAMMFVILTRVKAKLNLPEWEKYPGL